MASPCCAAARRARISSASPGRRRAAAISPASYSRSSSRRASSRGSPIELGQGRPIGPPRLHGVGHRGAFADVRGVYPLSQHELDGWRRALTARRDRLATQKIRDLFVFVPNKDQAYPEHLPPAFTSAGAARIDQVMAYMRQHSDVDLLDLRPSIWAEKKNDRAGDYVYHRLGTHWEISIAAPTRRTSRSPSA